MNLKTKSISIIILLCMICSCNNSQKQDDIEINHKEELTNEKLNDSIKESEVFYKKSDSLKEYCNERYNFCISYLASFMPQGESYNGDGQKFVSKDGKAVISAYGGLAIIDISDDIEKVYNTAISDEKITYKVLKNNYFIISGYDENNNIFYRKTVSKTINYFDEENTNIYQTLIITYPKSQIEKYKDYCNIISKSLR